nr:GNAT family N-acetyltransferase [Lysinibacillus timonensis]
MLKCDVINKIHQLQQFKHTWTNILEEEQNNNPFIEYEWIYSWWNCIGQNNPNIEIYVVRENDAPIAFFPFIRKQKANIQIVSFIGDKTSNYMDIIVKGSHKQVAIEFMLDWLFQKYKHIIFNLRGLLESNDTTNMIQDYFIQRKLPYSLFRTVSPYIQLEDINLEDFLYERRKLHGMDRREKRLKQFGNIAFIRANVNNLDKIYDIFNRRWAKKIDTSDFTSLENKQFVNELMLSNSNSLSIEVDALTFENKWIGFRYGIGCRGRYISYALGHLPSFEIFGPGRLLDREKIIDASRNHYQIYDFSIGHENYKFDWSTNLDYTRKYVARSKGLKTWLVAGQFILKEKVIDILKKRKSIVHFKRNTLGLFKYMVKNKSYEELKKLVNNIFPLKVFSIYEYNSQKLEKNCSKLYEPIAMKEAIWTNEKIISYYYKGYIPYKKEDGISFLLHPKCIRIDTVNYIQSLKKSNCYISEYELSELKEITAFLLNSNNYKSIYTTTNFLNFRKQRELWKQQYRKRSVLFQLKLFKREWKWEKFLEGEDPILQISNLHKNEPTLLKNLQMKTKNVNSIVCKLIIKINRWRDTRLIKKK